MRPHPAFAGREIPRRVTLGPFHLHWLTLADADEDYAAVMESAEALAAQSHDGWPAGLTEEENRIDLAWHQREFTAGRSFAWVIRDGRGAYLGCAYVYPSIAGLAEAEVRFWFRSTAVVDRGDFARRLMAWLSGPPWPPLTMRLTTPA
ncbi:MAG: hypothetical protein KatS3mg118_1050 [Paracoccaceae bacterium]|nr:MAG: hypothetical protein D6686_13290 [Alphaproteobacteria bacterium]GIX13091.1 MAG: hypothetical protein KatS3mg118_1050 [Paracoccaceae bacterium]